MCSIIHNLYGFDYDDLFLNLRLYNVEHPNYNIDERSSYSDIVYEYRNKLFIVEMNNFYYEKSIYKNHFYLLFRHIFDANNRNGYNKYKETYLIDIDNFDIVREMGIKKESKFIRHGRLIIEEEGICIYKNIHTTRINLDYLRNLKYNYNTLSDIERDCLVFIERDKEKLKRYGNYEKTKGVIEMLEIIEKDGKYFPVFDKEEWEESLREEMHERGLKKGIEQGRIEEKKALAKTLKLKNYTDKEIMELTGLDVDTINFS